ncbi:hypothetical protein TNCV_1648351 [Trichonephila clavipes]|uniref:Uncharacterized protein n=1 Tax=Trichonephila clavipes TaxID=2585209 RepID=A0A8X6RLN6_TRICX|nr:hypothetical protein TNCV_1648351 [Trichonephila clavipes]
MSIARKFIEVIGEDIFASKMKRLEISLEEDNFFRATTSQSSNNSRSTELNLFPISQDWQRTHSSTLENRTLVWA